MRRSHLIKPIGDSAPMLAILLIYRRFPGALIFKAGLLGARGVCRRIVRSSASNWRILIAFLMLIGVTGEVGVYAVGCWDAMAGRRTGFH